MKKLLYGLLALSCLACTQASEQPTDVLAENDFERIEGWTSGVALPSFTTEKAHSGRYAVKVAPGIDNSFGYDNSLGRLSLARLEKIRVHAWVLVPSDSASAVLVVEVRNPGQEQPVLREAIDLKGRAAVDGFGHWVELEKLLALPPSTTYESQLKVYLWRGDSTQPTYLDDLQLLRADK